MKLFGQGSGEKITKDTTIVKILSAYPLARSLLQKYNIQFVGKAVTPVDMLERAAQANGLSDADLQRLLAELNEGMKQKESANMAAPSIILTPQAAEKLKEMVRSKKGKKGIRLRLASDGCLLYTYDMDFGTKRLEGEIELKTQGLTFYLEKKTIGLLQGLEIEYREQEGGFFFKNPNVQEKAGLTVIQ